MRYCILILLLFIPWPISAQNVNAPQVLMKDKGVLIRNIEIGGFVLGDKNQFIKLFKPYRNKYLKTSDMDEILQEIQAIYERGGYKELVSISYQVIKRRLIFTVLMSS